MQIMWQEDGSRRRWPLWLGLLAAAALAGLVAGLYRSSNEPMPQLQPLSQQGATAPIPPPPQAANGTAAPQPAVSANLPAWLAYAVPAPPASGKPRIALVIDDLGLDSARTGRALKLKGPLTLVFLAYAGNLPQQAEAARKAGDELLLHVATGGMTSAISLGPDQTPGAPPPEETLRRLRWDLDRLPAYIGVDLPASVSADPQYLPVVMGELKTRGLLFLDNRADAAALASAQNWGVPYVARDATLDGTGGRCRRPAGANRGSRAQERRRRRFRPRRRPDARRAQALATHLGQEGLRAGAAFRRRQDAQRRGLTAGPPMR